MPSTLQGGNIQGPSNSVVPNGWIELSINVDAQVLAPPYGQVMSTIPIIYYFDSTGNIRNPQPPGGAPIVYGAPELTPSGTFYLVNYFDANGAKVNKNQMIYVFPQVSGSTINLSQMIPRGR